MAPDNVGVRDQEFLCALFLARVPCRKGCPECSIVSSVFSRGEVADDGDLIVYDLCNWSRGRFRSRFPLPDGAYGGSAHTLQISPRYLPHQHIGCPSDWLDRQLDYAKNSAFQHSSHFGDWLSGRLHDLQHYELGRVFVVACWSGPAQLLLPVW